MNSIAEGSGGLRDIGCTHSGVLVLIRVVLPNSPSSCLCADKHMPVAGNGLECKFGYEIVVIHSVVVETLDLLF